MRTEKLRELLKSQVQDPELIFLIENVKDMVLIKSVYSLLMKAEDKFKVKEIPSGESKPLESKATEKPKIVDSGETKTKITTPKEEKEPSIKTERFGNYEGLHPETARHMHEATAIADKAEPEHFGLALTGNHDALGEIINNKGFQKMVHAGMGHVLESLHDRPKSIDHTVRRLDNPKVKEDKEALEHDLAIHKGSHKSDIKNVATLVHFLDSVGALNNKDHPLGLIDHTAKKPLTAKDFIKKIVGGVDGTTLSLGGAAFPKVSVIGRSSPKTIGEKHGAGGDTESNVITHTLFNNLGMLGFTQGENKKIAKILSDTKLTNAQKQKQIEAVAPVDHVKNKIAAFINNMKDPDTTVERAITGGVHPETNEFINADPRFKHPMHAEQAKKHKETDFDKDLKTPDGMSHVEKWLKPEQSENDAQRADFVAKLMAGKTPAQKEKGGWAERSAAIKQAKGQPIARQVTGWDPKKGEVYHEDVKAATKRTINDTVGQIRAEKAAKAEREKNKLEIGRKLGTQFGSIYRQGGTTPEAPAEKSLDDIMSDMWQNDGDREKYITPIVSTISKHISPLVDKPNPGALKDTIGKFADEVFGSLGSLNEEIKSRNKKLAEDKDLPNQISNSIFDNPQISELLNGEMAQLLGNHDIPAKDVEHAFASSKNENVRNLSKILDLPGIAQRVKEEELGGELPEAATPQKQKSALIQQELGGGGRTKEGDALPLGAGNVTSASGALGTTKDEQEARQRIETARIRLQNLITNPPKGGIDPNYLKQLKILQEKIGHPDLPNEDKENIDRKLVLKPKTEEEKEFVIPDHMKNAIQTMSGAILSKLQALSDPSKRKKGQARKITEDMAERLQEAQTPAKLNKQALNVLNGFTMDKDNNLLKTNKDGTKTPIPRLKDETPEQYSHRVLGSYLNSAAVHTGSDLMSFGRSNYNRYGRDLINALHGEDIGIDDHENGHANLQKLKNLEKLIDIFPGGKK